jgi:hypothetical protein
MMPLSEQIAELQENQLLPNSKYISRARFLTHYENTKEFWEDGFGNIIVAPLFNTLVATYYTLNAVWATLRAVGNLLILKPVAAGEALYDFGTCITLTVALAAMAPIHALTAAIELLTRTASSWFTGAEPQEQWNPSLEERFAHEMKHFRSLLPTKNYLNSSKFFRSHENVTSFLSSVYSPVGTFLGSGLFSLDQAFKAVISAIDCLANLAICKPQHALDALGYVGIHTSLAIALALMAPVNALVYGIACITRLGSTWVSACLDSEEPEQPDMGIMYQ